MFMNMTSFFFIFLKTMRYGVKLIVGRMTNNKNIKFFIPNFGVQLTTFSLALSFTGDIFPVKLMTIIFFNCHLFLLTLASNPHFSMNYVSFGLPNPSSCTCWPPLYLSTPSQ